MPEILIPNQHEVEDNYKGMQKIKSGSILSEYSEIILGYTLVMAVNFFWFRSQMGFLDVAPHPFWLVILPLAVRYGFKAGVISALAGALIYAAMVRLNNPDLLLSQFTAGKYWKDPVLFVLVGIVLGEMREVYKREYLDLNQSHTDLERDFKKLTGRYEALSQAKQEVDTRIISQEHTLATFYEAAQALKSLQEEDIYLAVIELAQKFVSAGRCSVYIVRENSLHLAARSGEEPPELGKTMDMFSGIMGRTISAERTVSINSLVYDDDFRGRTDSEIVICSPLMGLDKSVIGVLNIEEIPFLKFNPQSVQMTSLLADWAGSAIENAREYRETKDKNISDDITGAYTFDYCEKRLAEEFSRARRYKITFSLMAVKLIDFDQFASEVKNDILIVLSLLFKNKLRIIDLVFLGRDYANFLIFLPSTDQVGAEIVRNKLLREIDAYQFRPYPDDERVFEVEVGSVEFSEKLESSEVMMEKAAEVAGRDR